MSDELGKSFTWIEGLPLSELRKPKNIKKIKEQHKIREDHFRNKRENIKLVEILAGIEEEEYRYRACLVCQL